MISLEKDIIKQQFRAQREQCIRVVACLPAINAHTGLLGVQSCCHFIVNVREQTMSLCLNLLFTSEIWNWSVTLQFCYIHAGLRIVNCSPTWNLITVKPWLTLIQIVLWLQLLMLHSKLKCCRNMQCEWNINWISYLNNVSIISSRYNTKVSFHICNMSTGKVKCVLRFVKLLLKIGWCYMSITS